MKRTLLALLPAIAGCGVSAEADLPPPPIHAVMIEDGVIVIDVVAIDLDGSYTATRPQHGALSGTGPTYTYQPDRDYNGDDGFVISIADADRTARVPVELVISPVDDAPIAPDVVATTTEDRGVAIALRAVDVDSTALTYEIVDAPTHGTLAGDPPLVTYTPFAHYHGADAFTVRASDGELASNVATVSVEVDAVAVAVAMPDELGWTPDFPIWQTGPSTFRPELDPASLRATTSRTLYVSPTGNDGNAGTAPGAAAKRTIAGAIAVPGSKTIFVQAGTYYGFMGAGIEADTNVIAYGDGPVILTEEAGVASWTAAGSGASATTIPGPFSRPYGVVDEAFADAYDVPAWLAPRASVAEVQALGGWYWEAGVLTVKPTDGRPADARLHAYPAVLNGFVVGTAGVTFDLEGIEVRGGSHGVWATDGARISVVDCRFLNPNGAGFRVDQATVGSYAIRSFAGGAYGLGSGIADGFNYSVAASTRSFEWDCVGVSNGSPYGPDAGNSCNGSSAHNGGKTIRIGGLYANNLGGDLTDVTGALTVNLGVTCTGSRRVIGSGPASIHVDSPDTRAWAAGAHLDDPVYLGSSGGAVLYLRDTAIVSSTGAGTLRAW